MNPIRWAVFSFLAPAVVSHPGLRHRDGAIPHQGWRHRDASATALPTHDEGWWQHPHEAHLATTHEGLRHRHVDMPPARVDDATTEPTPPAYIVDLEAHDDDECWDEAYLVTTARLDSRPGLLAEPYCVGSSLNYDVCEDCPAVFWREDGAETDPLVVRDLEGLEESLDRGPELGVFGFRRLIDAARMPLSLAS